jgi:hypothetical protein
MAATVTASNHASSSGASTTLSVSAVVATGDRLLVLVMAETLSLSLTSVVRGAQSGIRRSSFQGFNYKIEVWAFDDPVVGTDDVDITSPSSVKLGAGVFSIAGSTPFLGSGFAPGYRSTVQPTDAAYVEAPTYYPPALGIAMMASNLSGQTIANVGNTALFADTGVGTTDVHLAAVSATALGPGGLLTAGLFASWDLGSVDTWGAVAVTIASGSGPTIIPPQILFGRAPSASAVATDYNSFPRAGGAFTTSTTERRTPALAAGTLSNLSVRVRTAPGGAASRVFTIQKNGVDTLLTVTISAADTVSTDTTNAATIVSGDTLQIKQVPSGTPAAADAIEWVCDFTPTTAGHCIHGGFTEGVDGALNTPCFNALLAPMAIFTWRQTVGNRQDIIAVPGTIEEWGVRTGVSFTSGVVYQFYLYKNGVKQDGTGGTVDSLITLTGTGAAPLTETKVVNLSMAVEDRVYVRCEQTAGVLVGFPAGPVVFCRFASDTPGTFNVASTQAVITATGFVAVSGNTRTDGDDGNATESLVKVRVGTSGLFIDGITVLATLAPGVSQSMNYKVRKNEADASVTAATITGTALWATGGGTPASYADGDFLDVQVSETGTPADAVFSFTLAGRVGTSGPNAYSITQLGALLGYDEDAEDDPPPTVTACTGGGTVANGTNPSAGTSLSTATQPHAWVEITPIGGSTVRYAAVGIPHGTMKEARVESLGTVKRQLCDADHGYEASVITSTLIDTDGALRALGSTLKGALVDYWIGDIATLKAGTTNMRRQFRGILDEWEAQSDRMFSITSVDALTARLTSIDADDLQTPVGLIDSSISDQGALDRMTDRPLPEPYGAISDEADAVPEGVWEAKHLGFITISGEEDLGNNPLFIISRGAVKNPQSVFGADVLSGDPPTLRVKLGESAFGDWRVDPEAFIYIRNYIVRGGRRVTLIIGKDRHPTIVQAVEGRIPLLVNFCARESTGDTTGTLIDNGGEAIPHWLNSSVLSDLGDANWPAQASFGDYSVLDTDTFGVVADILTALDYKFAGVFGGDFEQRSWRDNLADALRSIGAEFYTNRHGQGCLSKLDVTATGSGATAFTTKQILEGSVSVDQKLDACENTIRYLYAVAYKGALPDLTPVEGSRLFRDPYDGKWGSGLEIDSDAASITALGGDPKGVRRSRAQEYYFVRDTDTADALAAERLALRAPAAGRAEVSFSTLLKYSCDVELGDIVTVEHWDLPWTGSRRCRVLAKETDLDEMVERLTVQDVDDLLA